MAASSAERQAAYRARQQRQYGVRLNLYLPEDAGRMLKRLARHNGLSQADMIAALIRAADQAAADALADDAAISDYYGVTP